MAEFCLECWNQLNGTNDTKWRYVLSWEKDLCEGCGQYKRVIVMERHWSYAERRWRQQDSNTRWCRCGPARSERQSTGLSHLDGFEPVGDTKKDSHP